jgi:hypothetical protein
VTEQFDNVKFLILLKGDRQIPVPGIDFAAQNRDLTIPTERAKNDCQM